MQPNPTNKRKFIIIGTALLLILIAFAAFLGVSKKTLQTPTSPTPSASSTPTPDSLSKGPNLPEFAGFDQLQDSGVTQNQIDAIKYAFSKYAKQINKQFKHVNLTNATVVPHDRYSASTTDLVNITTTIDGTSYTGKIEYSGYYAARLYLNKPSTATVVFDSGIIDLFHGTGDN